jgi:hypothetical protein
MSENSVSVAVQFGVGLLLLAACIVASVRVDNRWRSNHPTHKRFRWGFFQAIWAVVGGAGLLLYCVANLILHFQEFSLRIAGIAMVEVVVGLVALAAGYELLKRKTKRSWIVITILSLNMVTWLINVVYGSNRWDEFAATGKTERQS